MSPIITISCLCGAARQTLSLPPQEPDASLDIALCHCDSCRHLTGLLCTSYIPIASTTPPSLVGLQSYSPCASSTRYFCSVCGCHAFRRIGGAHESQCQWEVATGTITVSPQDDVPSLGPKPYRWRHLHAGDSTDGGLSPYLSGNSNANPAPTPSGRHPDLPAESLQSLPASCHCGRVSLTITRPRRASTTPKSNYADLLLAYHSTPSSLVSNPGSVKWWLRDPSSSAFPPHSDAEHHPARDVLEQASEQDLAGYRYLAGTCACRSCRLASGFEIQTWAFIPRCNIFVNLPPGSEAVPLDFSDLPGDLLKSYRSSPAAAREFCPTCGATVFWHDVHRPDLIDVSVGLFRCPSGGSRAEPFLKWWMGRVSFAEETKTERTGFIANWAQHLVTSLEAGLKQDSETLYVTMLG